MGNQTSNPQENEPEDEFAKFDGVDTLGYRVLGVQPNSPASAAGLVSFLDFLVGCNGEMLLGSGEGLEEGEEYDDIDFPGVLRDNVGKELELCENFLDDFFVFVKYFSYNFLNLIQNHFIFLTHNECIISEKSGTQHQIKLPTPSQNHTHLRLGRSRPSWRYHPTGQLRRRGRTSHPCPLRRTQLPCCHRRSGSHVGFPLGDDVHLI